MNDRDKKGLCGYCREFWDEISEVRKHFLTAEKELLLAVRSIVDLLVEKTEDRMPAEKVKKAPAKS
jgi:hypothetical protein